MFEKGTQTTDTPEAYKLKCARATKVSAVASNDGLCAHELKRQLDSLLNKVNAVTCPHRHGQKVTDRVLIELSNRQLDVEKALREMGA